MCFDNRMSVLLVGWLIGGLLLSPTGSFFFVVFCPFFRPFVLFLFPVHFLCFPPLVRVKLDVRYCDVCK
jgi:hypothetical protein